MNKIITILLILISNVSIAQSMWSSKSTYTRLDPGNKVYNNTSNSIDTISINDRIDVTGSFSNHYTIKKAGVYRDMEVLRYTASCIDEKGISCTVLIIQGEDLRQEVTISYQNHFIRYEVYQSDFDINKLFAGINKKR